MQTTLRIDDHLYRDAKAEAAREGVTLTRFLEEGIRLRLEKKPRQEASNWDFRVCGGDSKDQLSGGDLKRISNEDQESSDLAKLGDRSIED